MPSWLDAALVAASLAVAARYAWRRLRAPDGCGSCPVGNAAGPTRRRPPGP